MIRNLDKYSGVRSCTLDNKHYLFGIDDLAFATLGAAAAGLIGSAVNTASQSKTNKKNMELNEKMMDYNAAMTRQGWERDDRAHQREVADLQAAGLSPLAATGGLGNTAPLTAPNPIQMQAPQIDTNTIVNAILEGSKLKETERHNKVLEGQTETELGQTAEKIKLQSEQLKLENKKVQATIDYQADIIDNQSKQIEETIRNNKAQEDLKKCSYLSEQYWKEIQEQTGGKCPSKDFYDFDIYVAHKKLWDLEYKHFLDEIGATQSASGSSDSQNLSGGFSLGAGAAGPNGNINAAEGTSHSEYKSENLTQKQEAMMHQWYSEHPMPVYHVYQRKN